MDSIIEKFYAAFKNIDGDEMAKCYHTNIVFEDPAFGILKGEKAKNMWRMLCESQKGQDFTVSFSNIKCDTETGAANWEAKYTFSQTGRKVHNIVAASFEIKDGLIIKHTDSFNLRNWAKQAMGFKGTLLGGTNFFRKKLIATTNKMLDKYEAKK